MLSIQGRQHVAKSELFILRVNEHESEGFQISTWLKQGNRESSDQIQARYLRQAWIDQIG